MASVDAIGSGPYPHEQGITLRACLRLHVGSNEGRGCVASWFYLHGPSIGIEFADQAIAVFLRGRCQMRDERLDEIPLGLLERWRAAEVGGVRLNQRGIEVVLADQEAEAVPQSRLTIFRAIWRV